MSGLLQNPSHMKFVWACLISAIAQVIWNVLPANQTISFFRAGMGQAELSTRTKP
jgi:hypothetical protein